MNYQKLNVSWPTMTTMVVLHTKSTQTNQMPFNRLLTYIFYQIKSMDSNTGFSQRNEKQHIRYMLLTLASVNVRKLNLQNTSLVLFYYNWQTNCFVNDGNTIFTLKIDNNGRAKLQNLSRNIEQRYIHSKMLGCSDLIPAIFLLRIERLHPFRN